MVKGVKRFALINEYTKYVLIIWNRLSDIIYWFMEGMVCRMAFPKPKLLIM